MRFLRVTRTYEGEEEYDAVVKIIVEDGDEFIGVTPLAIYFGKGERLYQVEALADVVEEPPTRLASELLRRILSLDPPAALAALLDTSAAAALYSEREPPDTVEGLALYIASRAALEECDCVEEIDSTIIAPTPRLEKTLRAVGGRPWHCYGTIAPVARIGGKCYLAPLI